jgi:hypothetical protein
MSLAEMGRVIRRRWYVLLPLLLLAATLTVGMDRSIPRQYQSTGMVSLLASQQSIKGTSTVPGTGNPFESFDSSLNDTADFLVRRLVSTEASQQLAGEGVGNYTAVLAASQGPFVQLTVTASTATATKAAMATLISYTSAQLQALQQQQGVPAQDMITSAVIVPDSAPAAQNKRRDEDSLGVGAAGLALAILATFATDSVASRRRRGRRPARRPGSTAGSAADANAAPEAFGALDGSAGEPITEPIGVGRGGTGRGERAAEPAPGRPGAGSGERISPLSEARD